MSKNTQRPTYPPRDLCERVLADIREVLARHGVALTGAYVVGAITLVWSDEDTLPDRECALGDGIIMDLPVILPATRSVGDRLIGLVDNLERANAPLPDVRAEHLVEASQNPAFVDALMNSRRLTEAAMRERAAERELWIHLERVLRITDARAQNVLDRNVMEADCTNFGELADKMSRAIQADVRLAFKDMRALKAARGVTT